MLEQWNTLRYLQTVSVKPAERTAAFPVPVKDAQEMEVQEQLTIDGYPIMGTLSIEKLNLHEPILEGADPETLKTGIGTVVPDRSPGSTGNYVIAGHRSWTFGKQFSRLNELETGDKVALDTQTATFMYSVTSKFLVEPDDLTVLEQSLDKSELTLITCEPKYNPTHRLIVKAVLEGKDTE